MREYNIAFGAAHSKSYKRPVISSFLTAHDAAGKVIKRHRDLYLLLRQKNLQQKIGLETIRNYVEKMIQPVTPMPNLSDDELFQLIEPKSIDNITDAYQYARYLQSRHNEVKDKYEELKAIKQRNAPVKQSDNSNTE